MTFSLPVIWLCSLPVMWLSIKPPKLAFFWALHLLARRTMTHVYMYVFMHVMHTWQWNSGAHLSAFVHYAMHDWVLCVSYDLRSCASTAAVASWEAVNETWMDDGNLIMINYSHDVAVMFCRVPASTVDPRVLWSSLYGPQCLVDCLYYLRKGSLF